MAEPDFTQARRNMVERQIRPWEVLDERVLTVLAQLPREAFVPQRWRDSAYSDCAIPLSADRAMLPPNVLARALQAVSPQAGDTALVIGDGSGYLLAAAAALAGAAIGVEPDIELAQAVAARLAEQGIAKASSNCGDAREGWPAREHYEVILVAASLPKVSSALRHQLAEGGRLFAVIGEPQRAVMNAVLIERVGPRDWREQALFETRIAPLFPAPPKAAFAF